MDFIAIIKDNTLSHHGILGQKWGVRRYQNKDGSLTQAGRIRVKGENKKSKLSRKYLNTDTKSLKSTRTDYGKDNDLYLKKGSKVNHVTPLDFKELRKGQDLFVSATDYDKNLYKTFLTLNMKNKGWGQDTPIKELELTLKEDLKAPSSNKQRKIFEDWYNNNKDLIEKDLNTYYGNKERPEDKYESFIKTIDSSNKLKSKNSFYKELEKSGYNAVLDEHDITGSWINAQQPLVLINAMNSVGDIKIKDLSNSDIKNAFNELYYK